jgi:hypothetical protein
MNNCPNCGGDARLARWAPGGCTCRREVEQSDPVDDALEVLGSCDYITPASETFGVSKYLVFVLALFLIAGVFATHGVLWG